jgi:uncharacterized tellurite resistance protein B-like protein
MAGVIEQLFRPQKTALQDRRSMELEAAREILAEVFRIKLSEVDEMIQNHYEKDPFEEGNSKGDRLWPQELWIEG